MPCWALLGERMVYFLGQDSGETYDYGGVEAIGR